MVFFIVCISIIVIGIIAYIAISLTEDKTDIPKKKPKKDFIEKVATVFKYVFIILFVINVAWYLIYSFYILGR